MTGIIIISCIFGLVIIFIIVFLILRYINKKKKLNDSDIDEENDEGLIN